MTDPAQIARLAEGLSEADRKTLLNQCGSYSEVVALDLDPLWYAISKLGGGQFRISLNRLGIAVAAHLTAAQEKK